MLQHTILVCLFLSLLGMHGQTALADEVTDSIHEAAKLYKEGNRAEAVSSLEYAAQLIRQQRGGSLEDLLPAPLPGWKAEEATSQAMGMFGGGVSADRNYTKGQSHISISLITDSPMLQGVMMMLANPMLASSDGGKLKKIKGKKAMVKYNSADSQGEVQMVINQSVWIHLEGRDVSEEDMLAYMETLDFDILESF